MLKSFNKPLNEFGLTDINRFKRKPVKPNAMNVYLRTLRSIFNKAKSFKLISEVPEITLLPVSDDKLNPITNVLEPIQKTYSREQFVRLLEYLWNDGKLIKRKANEFGFDTFDNQFKLLEYCLIAFYTGCRRGEILNMCVGHIDKEKRLIPVIQYKKRGKQRLKLVPIHPYLWERVIKNKLTLDPECRLCDLKEDYVTNKIKKINKLLGFGDLKQHSIRHTYATELMKLEVDRYSIKDLLGHSAVSTSEIYVHTDSVLLKEQNSKLPELNYG